MQDELDLKNALEAAFGPGAFEMLAELDAEESAAAGQLIAEQQDFQVATAEHDAPANRSQNQAAVATGTPSLEHQTLCLFESAGTCFGVSISSVVEIQRVPSVTRIQRGPAWFLGLANLRGKIISVVDLQLIVGGTPSQSRDDQRLIVVRSHADGTTTGLIVDSVSGIRGAVTSVADQTATTESISDPYVRELVQCDGRLVAILDLERVLHFSDIGQFQPI